MKTQPPPVPGSRISEDEETKALLTTKIIHGAMVAGLLMFGGVVGLMCGARISLTPVYDDPMILLSCLVCIATLVLSFFVFPMYRKMISASNGSAVGRYQTLCMMRWAVIEGGALFAMVTVLLTKNILPVCAFVISVVFMIYRYPSRQEFLDISEDRQGWS